MKVHTIDTIGLIVLIIEIVWRVVCSRFEPVPSWMGIISFALLGLIILVIIAHFIAKHFEKKEKKQNK